MDATKRKLVAMLTENTGIAMLDSGGASGRNWQRNQGRNFEAEPAVSLSTWGESGEFRPDVTISVYHFLSQALTAAPDMNRRYQAYARARRADEYEMGIMESFMDYLREKGHEIAGIYGDGDPITINTYNGESFLSQTLQYVYFSCDREEYALLQIHGGADVRGGYTDAVAFYADSDCGTSLFDNAKATIYADGPGAFHTLPYWTTDDGWNFYREGGSEGRKLHDYELSTDPAHKGDGEHVWLDEDGKPHCPETGLPLAASF